MRDQYDAIVTIVLIDPFIFSLFFLVAPVGESCLIFTHMINIFMMIKFIGSLTLVFLPG